MFITTMSRCWKWNYIQNKRKDMKQIWIALALLFVAVSCGKSSDTADVKEETTQERTDTLDMESDSVDAVTSATAVANVPSFNGVIMLPPEKHATVTLMMDGTIQDIHLFPGEYVKKGEVIATLKIPILSVFSRSIWMLRLRWNTLKRSMPVSRI